MLAGCAKEAEQPEVTTAPEVVMVDISLTATMEKENGVTKATVDDTDGSFAWVKGDQVAVFTKNGNLIVLEAEEAGSTTTLTGKIAEDDALEEGAIAYYPAAIAVKDDATKVNMPSSYESADAARQGFPMRGVLNAEKKLEFKHLGALVKITVDHLRNEIDQVVVSLPKLATGELAVATDKNSQYVVNATSGESTITIGIGPDQVTRASGTGLGEFYVPLPVGEYAGFSFTFQSSTFGVFGTQTTTKNLAVSRASLKKMARFTVPGMYAAVQYVYNIDDYTKGEPLFLQENGWYVMKNFAATSSYYRFKLYNNGSNDTSGAVPGWWGVSSTTTLEEDVLKTVNNTDSYKSTIQLPTGTWDFYFHSILGKVLIKKAGAEFNNDYRTVYVMSDMELTDQTYTLYVWPKGGSDPGWPGVTGRKVKLGGIPYYGFTFSKTASSNKLSNGEFNLILSNNGGTTPRYDLNTSGNNLTTVEGTDVYYLSFTGPNYNGDSRSNNKATQFTDPAHPQGESYWGVTVTEDGTTTFTTMEWDNSPNLLSKKVVIGPDSDVYIKFNNKDGHAYNTKVSTVETDTWTEVEYITSTPSAFKVNLDKKYFCNVYFNKFSNQIKIVPIAAWAEDPITVDGDFSDWDSIEGNTLTGGYNNAGNETTMKAVSNADGSKIWIYVKVDAPAGANPTSGNWLKFRVDTDNKATTGSTDGWCGGADSNEILAYILSGFNSMDSKYSPEWKYVVNDEANSVEIECGFKVGAAGITPGSTVKVFSLGYVPEQFNGATPAVVIPSID